MATHLAWNSFWPDFREKQMKTLTGWIDKGESGAVVGIGGAGKTNLIGFLCHFPRALDRYLGDRAQAIDLIPVDLNNLPAYNLATFYRVVLRAFFEIRDRFTPELQAIVTELYLANRAERDPFMSQSALRELLLHFQSHDRRVVMVFDRFDYFCETAPPILFHTLHGLRDSFKDTLSYIVATNREIAYLPKPESLGNLRALLDRLVCWVGSMNEADSRLMIERETKTANLAPTDVEMKYLFEITGGYPALLKVACRWWEEKGHRLSPEDWLETLMSKQSIEYRLIKIWDGLTQEEQLTLTAIQNQPNGDLKPASYIACKHQRTLDRLVQKDLCLYHNGTYSVKIRLLAVYAARMVKDYPDRRGKGELWLDHSNEQIYQGDTPLDDLAPLERAILDYLVTTTDRPGKLFTKTEILTNAWPNDTGYEASDVALEQMIYRVRRKIEPESPNYRYILTHRARRGSFDEGGYRFYPEGKQKAA